LGVFLPERIAAYRQEKGAVSSVFCQVTVSVNRAIRGGNRKFYGGRMRPAGLQVLSHLDPALLWWWELSGRLMGLVPGQWYIVFQGFVGFFFISECIQNFSYNFIKNDILFIKEFTGITTTKLEITQGSTKHSAQQGESW